MRWTSIWVGLLVLLGPAASLAASIGLREVGTGNTSAVVLAGNSIDLELYLDTEGLDFSGYYLGIDFTGGAFTIQSVTHQPLTGLFADLLGSPVIDNVAGTIRHLNQTTLVSPLGAGEYILDIITLQVGVLGPGEVITATAGLFGEVLGLGGGSCPGTTVGCTVSFNSFEVVPEPGTGLLVSCGLLSLAFQRRHANRHNLRLH